MPVGNQVNELPAEVHDDMLKSAEQGYQDVVKLTTGTKTPGLDPVYELNARLGLASVAEDRSQWDQARRGYTDIAAAADQAHLPLIGALARALLARIDARTQPVILDTTTTINVPLPGAATTAPAPGTQPAFDLGPLTPTTQRSR
jgi:hypothetical protein